MEHGAFTADWQANPTNEYGSMSTSNFIAPPLTYSKFDNEVPNFSHMARQNPTAANGAIKSSKSLQSGLIRMKSSMENEHTASPRLNPYQDALDSLHREPSSTQDAKIVEPKR